MSSFSESAVTRDQKGQFAGTTTGATPPFVLGFDGLSDDEAQIEAYAAEQVARSGAGMDYHARQDMDRCGSPAGRALYLADFHNESLQAHLSPQDASRLADAGYATTDDLDLARDQGVIDGSYGYVRVIDPAPSIERLREVHAARPALKFNQSDPWVREAMLHGDASKFTDAKRTWDVVAAHDPVRGAMLKTGIEGGLASETVRSARDLSNVQDLVAMKAASPKTNDQDLRRIVDNNHNQTTLKRYGVNLARDFDANELGGATSTPAALRSLHGGVPDASLKELDKLSAAGLTNGNDAKYLRAALASKSIASMAAAAKKVPVSSLVEYHSRTRHPLTTSDVGYIKTLTDNGYLTSKSADAMVKFMSRETMRHRSDARDGLANYAALAETKLSPRQIGVMSRAGIPPTDMGKHKDSKDVWAAGAPYRDHYEAQEQAAKKRGWDREAGRKWPFTASDYDQLGD